MKENRLKIALVGVGTVLFHLLFWEEGLGLNLVLFSSYIVLGNLITRATKWNPKMWASMIGLMLSLCSTFIFNSSVSILAALISLIVFVGFAQNEKLRYLWSNLMTFIISVFQLPKLKSKDGARFTSSSLAKIKRVLKLVIIPLLVLGVFMVIFRIANPIFNSGLTSVENWLLDHFSGFFKNLSIPSLLFFIIGFFITSTLLIKGKRMYFVDKDVAKDENIIRKRTRKKTVLYSYKEEGVQKTRMGYPSIPFLGLKNERFSAIVLLSLINLLLLIINSIDVTFVWFNKAIVSTHNLTEMIHEGTYLLILSILLSMLVMLYVFRKNQNFYKKNRRLKQLAYAWIAQNGILIISVIIRNHNYISEYGLTHKRIGVYIFLLLTIVGLFFLYLKIKNKKSLYYLMLNNSWAVYTSLVLMGMVNWDGVIAVYNLKYVKQENVNYKHLVQLSDNALISISQNQGYLDPILWNKERYIGRQRISPAEYFHNRISNIRYNSTQSLKSWNYAEYSRNQYFMNK
ncbi:MAG: DUF4173 domain-containing protein [Flavobacteriales bacterium]|jgi:hypothetical protein|nr:DUF4173 domain-containing protein [Flavobacteriales bacterium]